VNDVTRTVDKLFSVGERLSPGLRQQIVALGTAAEPRLLELIGDDRLFETDARGRGWTPLHAMEILGELGATAAIPRLLELLRDCDVDEYAHSYASRALTLIGGNALEPCLAAYAGSDDEEFRSSLACVVAELKVRDERVYQILVAEFAQNRVLGAGNFAAYGDPRALELLTRAFDDCEIAEDPADGLAGQEVIEIGDALVQLAGQLTQRQQAKLDRVKAIRRRRRAQVDDAASRPGRNDPCHCGSGAKYKSCHLAADEEADRS
jgi:HEAT repeat protein